MEDRVMQNEVKTLVATEKQHVTYCVPTWLRDEQIRQNIARVKGRVAPAQDLCRDKIAVVCFGPSLNDTWEELRNFQYIMTCSGAHKFLVDHGITPTWHIDVDPREHKAKLIGQPQRETEYLIASACHPAVFDLLEGYNVKLWHIFDTAEEGFRILPEGEWALTGGCGAGLRAMVMARFLGFTDQHIFGMDGNQRDDFGKHAAAHPSQAQKHAITEYNGVQYKTTQAFLEAARTTFHELDQMPDVRATFHGEGLVQAMAKDYKPKPVDGSQTSLGFVKPELISAELRNLNAKLHQDNLFYGVGGGRHTKVVLQICQNLKTNSVLDYGCGKGYLGKALDFPIWEYDPAILLKSESPRPADIVVCTDVLEHIEPDKLMFVLGDISRCMKKVGYFVIHTGPAKKFYSNGRNTHLIQQDKTWWHKQIKQIFVIGQSFMVGQELHLVVGAKTKQIANVKPNFSKLTFRHDPYAIGVATEVFDSATYKLLAKAFPPIELFKKFDAKAKKSSLSETSNNPEKYAEFLKDSPAWQAFHTYVKRPEFVEEVFAVLEQQGVTVREAGASYTTRFEFSAMPADGGCIQPHTDIPSKVVTLVISMLVTPDDWNVAYGGGTDVLKPKDAKDFTGLDYKCAFSDFDVVHTFPYVPNQCVIFVKTANSWHSVGPMLGTNSNLQRKTVTLNIERVGT
jgi:2-polyprenyl-3-methyl-5-hydroxy-6-metoxy-1,4-benzoquinol methylase/uncharacterized Rossmann fold enzyme